MKTSDSTQNKKKSGGKCCLILVIPMILLFSFIGFIFIYYNFIKQYPEDNPTAKIIEQEAAKQGENQQVPPAPKEKLMEYFTNIAFTDNNAETNNNVARNNLRKWDKQEVGIELSGDFNQSVSDFLGELIDNFNNISNSTKLIAVKNSGDIQIKFQSRESLARLIANPKLLSRGNYAWTATSNNCQLTAATIYMQSDMKNNELLMKYTLGHELFHALGFTGHDTGGKYCNYMAPIPCGPIEGFTQYDEFAVKSAYSSGLKACESKTTVLQRLK